MQQVTVYLKKIESKSRERKEREKELSRCGWELFYAGMEKEYGLDGRKERIERNVHGKPHLAEHPEICFNLSHSGEYAACAFAEIPIGLDLQQHRVISWKQMAKRYFSKPDQERIDAAENGKELFFQIWTEEESYGKWKGTGLSGGTGKEEKEGVCTHFCPETGYEGAIWAKEKVEVCLKVL